MAKSPIAPKQGHMLPRYLIVGLLSLTVLVEAFIFAGGFALFGKDNNLAAVLPGVVAMLTNTARTEDHLIALTENELLAKGAQMKADDMAEKGYFSHVGPDGSAPWKWFKEAGYTYEYAGENLAVNFNESEDVVDAWLKSPTHRANILKAQFTEIGIGIAKGEYKGKQTTFVVQFFGKPGATTVANDPNAAAKTKPEDLLVSGEVLGTSTESIIEQITTSPMTPEKQTFFWLLGAAVALLVAGLLFGKKFPKLWPTIVILLVLAIVLGFAIQNRDVLLGEVSIENGA